MFKFKANEKGFTLIEVLVTLGILSAIMGVMSTAAVVSMRASKQNNEWNVNLRQVQNAGHWISRDALMAQTVSDSTPGVFLALGWSDWYGNSDNVNYILDGNTLKRRLNGGDGVLIAEYIVPSHTSCDWVSDNRTLTVTIRASLNGNRYAEKTYAISPRPGG